MESTYHRATSMQQGGLFAPLTPTTPGFRRCGLQPAQLTVDLITKAFKKMVKEVGMPHLTPHGLRHQYATAAREAGIEMGIISKNMGHASVAITEISTPI